MIRKVGKVGQVVMGRDEEEGKYRRRREEGKVTIRMSKMSQQITLLTIT